MTSLLLLKEHQPTDPNHASLVQHGSTTGKTLGLGRGQRELPLEIFVEILLMACRNVKTDCGVELNILSTADLQRLALVCKGWYNVISSTPSFWTTSAKGADLNGLAEHLSHTANATLRFIPFELADKPLPRASLDLILSQRHRFGTISLSLSTPDLPLFFEILTHAAPDLHDLTLYVGEPQEEPSFLPVSLFQGSRPLLLKRLTLSGLRISWTSPGLSSNLTELYLGSQARFSSYDEFFDLAGRLKSVHALTLFNCLPLPTIDSACKIKLPNLSRLTLTDDADIMIGALKSFAVSLCFLSVTCRLNTPQTQVILDECIRLLDPYLPSSSRSTTNYCSGLTMDLTTDPSPRVEVCCCVSSRDDTVTLERALETSFEMNPDDVDLNTALETSLAKLPLAKLTAITVGYLPSNGAHFWVNTIGKQMWALEKISITRRNAYLDFLGAYQLYLDGLAPDSLENDEIFVHLISIEYQEYFDEGVDVSETEYESKRVSYINDKRSWLDLPAIEFSIVKAHEELSVELFRGHRRFYPL
ncbi:hypothetical protein ONZ45_g13621 [Pleurotus djamor]|nr:hypothetical protein ONZ45_g13621 [Pleurotus djamor]